MSYGWHCCVSVITAPCRSTRDVESGKGTLGTPELSYPTPPMKSSTCSPPFPPRAQKVNCLAPVRFTPAFATAPKFDDGVTCLRTSVPLRKYQPPKFVPFVF